MKAVYKTMYITENQDFYNPVLNIELPKELHIKNQLATQGLVTINKLSQVSLAATSVKMNPHTHSLPFTIPGLLAGGAEVKILASLDHQQH